MRKFYTPIVLVLAFVFSQGKVFTQETSSTTVHFESGSFTLSTSDIALLAQLKKEIGVKKVAAVLIKGYADDIGTSQSNYVLSKNRALEVKEQMGRLGFPISRNDRTEGLGELNIIEAEAPIEEQRKANRRADIVIEYSPEVVIEENAVTKEEVKAVSVSPLSTKKLNSSLKVGDKVLMKNLIFIGGRDLLRNENNPDLDTIVAFMAANPKHKIEILGHVCCVNTGLDGFNTETETRTLSVDRAKKIYEMLAARGVERRRMSYRGLKALYPTGLGEVADRRVEIQISSIEE